jgi:lysyl-tRNA synthetase, class II
MKLSEQEIIRREKLKKLHEFQINPYPAREYKINAYCKQLKEDFQDGKQVSLAGRLMAIRIMGKASFATLKDSTEEIQLYIARDEISNDEEKTAYNVFFKKLLDIGDIIGVEGFIFKTKVGEISVHVKKITLLSKALKPLPQVKTDEKGNVYDSFSDPESRYRMRYVDLIVNEGIKERFIKRSLIIQSIREYLNKHAYLEVETPILQPIPGGASARPFITHHNTLDMPMYLRIANELYLKRLIVGGFEGVYEFAKDFRNEGMDRTHNPEFTILELYVAYKDYYWMMDFTEKLFEEIALKLNKNTNIKVGDKTISFKAPFKRISIYKAIKNYTGEDVSQMDEVALTNFCQKLGIEIDPSMGKGKLIDVIFGDKCEPFIIEPTFILDYPIEMSPLTKKHRSKSGLTERFELIINGKEIANSYSELNDPIDQLARFEDQLKLSQKGDKEAMFIDHDFIRALEYGMPPTAGIGIGIDRLVMLLTNQASIQEVLFFPQMKQKEEF